MRYIDGIAMKEKTALIPVIVFAVGMVAAGSSRSSDSVGTELNAPDRLSSGMAIELPGQTPTTAPAARRPQVTGVKVMHRAGQTFVTWVEADEPTLATDQHPSVVITLRAELSKRYLYQIYRSAEPIVDLRGLRPIGTAQPLGAWNTDFFGLAPPDNARAFRYRVIDRGEPLQRNNGLYVHNPSQPGRAYYAVTLSTEGVENRVLSTENSTSQVVT
jgi:hypothetical protein